MCVGVCAHSLLLWLRLAPFFSLLLCVSRSLATPLSLVRVQQELAVSARNSCGCIDRSLNSSNTITVRWLRTTPIRFFFSRCATRLCQLRFSLLYPQMCVYVSLFVSCAPLFAAHFFFVVRRLPHSSFVFVIEVHLFTNCAFFSKNPLYFLRGRTCVRTCECVLLFSVFPSP